MYKKQGKYCPVNMRFDELYDRFSNKEDVNFMLNPFLPLGPLSREQIEKGQDLLSLHNETSTIQEVLDLTNEYFTLIPHQFGNNNVPLLDNSRIIGKEIQLLQEQLF